MNERLVLHSQYQTLLKFERALRLAYDAWELADQVAARLREIEIFLEEENQ